MKSPWEQEVEPTTMSTHISRQVRGIKPGPHYWEAILLVECVDDLEFHNAHGTKSTCKFMDFILVVPQVSVYSNSGCVLLCVIQKPLMTGTAYTVV